MIFVSLLLKDRTMQSHEPNCSSFSRLIVICTITCLFIVTDVFAPASQYSLIGGIAMADDNDDDDDDDDDDRGGSRASSNSTSSGGRSTGSSGGRLFQRLFKNEPAPRQKATPAPRKTRPVQREQAPVLRTAPPPDRAPNEIVALGLTPASITTLETEGYSVIEEYLVALSGRSGVRLRTPSGVDLESARQRVRTLDPDATADFNHFYRSESDRSVELNRCSGPQCMAPKLISWSGPDAVCDGRVRIGMIDTGINTDHEALAGKKIRLLDFDSTGITKVLPSRQQHGTAVATLLLGHNQSRSPGLLPDAELVAIDTFHRSGGDERTDVFSLVKAMDQISAESISVLNMSLAGPPNELLEDMVATVNGENIVIVAAAGNGGPRAQPAYPAAYASVIAVTAVDSNKRIFRRAIQGEHIDLSAPGVDVWTAASIRGARWKTGTSFAAPFVTAAAALTRQARPDASPANVAMALKQNAIDLGEPGKDIVYGFGLLNAQNLCTPTNTRPDDN